MKLHTLTFTLMCCGELCAVNITRVFRAPHLTRDNTNVGIVQPIDEASWIWAPAPNLSTPVFLRFRKTFEVKAGEPKLTIDISADERYHLALDGQFVGRGPNRSAVDNWQYNTYEIALEPGRHIFEATAWTVGDNAPLAQLSWRGGFILKASGPYDARLTTGRTPWQVGVLDGVVASGKDNGAWGTGAQWTITGTGILDGEPKAWTVAKVVRGPAARSVQMTHGSRTPGWMLFPSQLPDQLEKAIRPGSVRAVTTDATWRVSHVYTMAETQDARIADINRLIQGKSPFTLPPHTRLQVAWDLGRYYCGYPVLACEPTSGARVSWTWTEASQRGSDKLKGGDAKSRDLIVGRFLGGFGDTFLPTAAAKGIFTVPWFRCGKWCRLDLETDDAPLTITDLHIVASRYPLELESRFATPQDPSLQDIRRICARAMQMCAHEMLFDCPYYEQQMYPGDTRVQLNVLSAMSQDDRLIKRAIELYDLATRDDGMCPFNWPTRGTQEGATYTLCYLCMYGDYVMNHADRAWLRARLPGLRKSMAGLEYYENADGLLENLPGWQFMDWVTGWRARGVAPGGCRGEGVNAEANLFWVLAMQSAEVTERALGHELQAAYWAEKRTRLAQTITRTFWSPSRELLADTPAKQDFSEHAQCLALLGDVLPPDLQERAFHHLVSDPDLKRATVYFSYYLFEAFFKMGRGDLFLKRLDLWREYVRRGLTTTQEAPDGGKNGQQESRSDCHAWGAHPIWFMQTGLAGIRSAAPFFTRVHVAPAPGPLATLTAHHPHPQGWIDVDLTFANGHATGMVTTPVAGDFVFGTQHLSLVPGHNPIQ